MRCPFPGMDPYLERRSLWEDVHNSLIASIRDSLGPVLYPRYYVALQERVVLVGAEGEAPDEPLGKPDLSLTRSPAGAPSSGPTRREVGPVAVRVRLPIPERVRETYLEIRSPDEDRVVTVMEILSLSNKLAGEQRREYVRKRGHVLASSASLVEIDLLRAGRRMPIETGGVEGHYTILVSRAGERPQGSLLAFLVSDPIPILRVPLDEGEDEPPVALGELLHALYGRAGYDLRVDYRADPPPPSFDPPALEWIRARLTAAGGRGV